MAVDPCLSSSIHNVFLQLLVGAAFDELSNADNLRENGELVRLPHHMPSKTRRLPPLQRGLRRGPGFVDVAPVLVDLHSGNVPAKLCQ